MPKDTYYRIECKTFMAVVGFEPTPPKRLVPKTSALDHSATLPHMIKVTDQKDETGGECCQIFLKKASKHINVTDHTAMKAPVLIRSLKLSMARLG